VSPIPPRCPAGWNLYQAFELAAKQAQRLGKTRAEYSAYNGCLDAYRRHNAECEICRKHHEAIAELSVLAEFPENPRVLVEKGA